MEITRKVATAAAAVSVSLAGFAGIGLTAASHAAATPARHHHHLPCTTKHGHPYPPDKCFVVFHKSTYHRGDIVHFHARRFNSGQLVTEDLKCGSFSKRVGSAHAGNHSGVYDKFRLPKKTPKGRCTLTVHGGNSSVHGSFKARH